MDRACDYGKLGGDPRPQGKNWHRSKVGVASGKGVKGIFFDHKKTRDVFRLDFQMKRSFIDYFSSFTEILEESNIINTKNITNKLGLSSSTVLAFFSKRKDILEKYGSFIKGKRDNPTEYHLNNYGITILRLIQYFKNNYCKTL